MRNSVFGDEIPRIGVIIYTNWHIYSEFHVLYSNFEQNSMNFVVLLRCCSILWKPQQIQLKNQSTYHSLALHAFKIVQFLLSDVTTVFQRNANWMKWWEKLNGRHWHSNNYEEKCIFTVAGKCMKRTIKSCSMHFLEIWKFSLFHDDFRFISLSFKTLTFVLMT